MRNTVHPGKIVCGIFILAAGMLSAQAPEKDILDIRKKYNEIHQALDSLATTDIYELGWSTEGGDARAYHKDNQVVMIKANWFGEMGKGECEYYFADEELIFAFYTDYRYNRPMYYNEEAAKENDDEPFDPSKTISSESRYYFKNKVLFRWLDDDKKLVDKAEYGARQQEIVVVSDELLARFKK